MSITQINPQEEGKIEQRLMDAEDIDAVPAGKMETHRGRRKGNPACKSRWQSIRALR